MLARLRRGEVVGEMSLVTGEARSATVVANVPTEVLELDREAFAATQRENRTRRRAPYSGQSGDVGKN